MKFKLDENLGLDVAQILREAGHDVSTIYDQKLQGATDEIIYDVCRSERHCLVTLDLDFGNVLRFPPETTAGIAVLRPPGKTVLRVLATLTRQLVKALDKERLDGRLWIVELERIRIHQTAEPYD